MMEPWPAAGLGAIDHAFGTKSSCCLLTQRAPASPGTASEARRSPRDLRPAIRLQFKSTSNWLICQKRCSTRSNRSSLIGRSETSAF